MSLAIDFIQAFPRDFAHVIEGLSEKPPQTNVDEDFRLLNQWTAERTRSPVVRLWLNSECLVTTRRLAKRHEYPEAATAAERAGWPVTIRRTGGSTVPHAKGVANVSLIHRTESLRPSVGYEPLLKILSKAIDRFGVTAVPGDVRGSLCDGAHNLTIDGRKVAGLAAFSRTLDATYWLVHASVFVDCELTVMVDMVSEFERRLGCNPRYEVERHTTLSAHLGRTTSCSEE